MKKSTFQERYADKQLVPKDSTMWWLMLLLVFLSVIIFYVLHHRIPNISLVFLFIASFFISLLKRYAARMKLDSAEEESRPLILYLRPFADDDQGWVTTGLIPETVEEKLERVFGKVGHFAAIGRPGEKLPTLGAQRMYVDEYWQKTVIDLMSSARLVVMRTGATEGITWELSQATKLLRPEQLLLVVPHDRKGYEAFRHKVQPFFHYSLPKYPAWKFSRLDLKGIVCFESDWTPSFITLKWMFLRGSALDGLPRALQMALRLVYARLGIVWRPPSVNWLRIFLLGLFALAIFNPFKHK